MKYTGWLEEKEGGYDDEARYAVNHRIIPIIQAFIDVISPKMVTYQGKLYKIYTLLSSIGTQANPYETVLKEVEEDMEDLNTSLRQLASSIEDHMDQLTQGKGIDGRKCKPICKSAFARPSGRGSRQPDRG